MTGLGLAAVLLLVLANGFFVIAEYALVTAPRAALQVLERDGRRGARTALALRDDPVRFIGTIQLAITGLGILLGALGEPILRRLFDPLLAAALSVALALTLVTYLTVVLGELVPKAIALHSATRVATLVAGPIALFGRLLLPAVWVLQVSARGVLRLFGVPTAPAGESVHTVEELRAIVAEAEDTGLIEEAEEEMLYRVFDFAAHEAGDVMVPWSHVATLDSDLDAGAALRAALETPYTRFPVLRGSIDDVVGLVTLRELVEATLAADGASPTIEPLARDLLVVPATKDVGALLQELRSAGAQMSLVVNEYGSTLGIVTLQDLVEEIVGEIEEEYGLPDESITRLPDGRLRVSGSFTIDDFNEQLRATLPTDRYRTLGGLVFGELGRAPRRGDRVEIADVAFEVAAVDGPRVSALLVALSIGPD
ncbi:MAG: hemolysin family protein [Solirubrobacteraceae bacterium]|nr:hemolysin family protein [Solirubrobacteraceae bacterium]